MKKDLEDDEILLGEAERTDEMETENQKKTLRTLGRWKLHPTSRESLLVDKKRKERMNKLWLSWAKLSTR